MLRKCHPVTVDDNERHSAPSRDIACSGKVEFCLTKLRALRVNSSSFAASRSIDVLNAFGLFALVKLERTRQASDTAYHFRVGSLRYFIGVRVGDEHLACLDALKLIDGLGTGAAGQDQRQS